MMDIQEQGWLFNSCHIFWATRHFCFPCRCCILYSETHVYLITFPTHKYTNSEHLIHEVLVSPDMMSGLRRRVAVCKWDLVLCILSWLCWRSSVLFIPARRWISIELQPCFKSLNPRMFYFLAWKQFFSVGSAWWVRPEVVFNWSLNSRLCLMTFL